MRWTSTRDPRIKKRGEIYYARFSRKGVRVESTLDTSNLTIAKDLCDKVEEAILCGNDWKEVLNPNLKKDEDKKQQELIGELYEGQFTTDKTNGARYDGGKVKKCRPATLYGYKSFYDLYYKEFWGLKTIDEITSSEWSNYLEFARSNSTNKNKTKMKNHWMYFSGFCSWLVLTKRLDKKPDIYNPDEDKDEDAESESDIDGVGKNLTDLELWNLREYSTGPAKLWIFMGQYMGMRTGEITQLKKSRINLQTGLITLLPKDTKIKKMRKVPIHPHVLELLKNKLEEAVDSEYIFPNHRDNARPMSTTGFGRQWDSLRLKFKIECRFHDLRHSCATRMFSDPNINPVLACKSLGMSMKTAMKVYIHFDETHLKQINSAFDLKSFEKASWADLGQIENRENLENT